MIFWIIQDGIGLSDDGLPLRQITKKWLKTLFARFRWIYELTGNTGLTKSSATIVIITYLSTQLPDYVYQRVCCRISFAMS